MPGTNSRVQKHRDSLRAAGMRPIQIWIPDTRKKGFNDECKRQSALVAKADAGDHELQQFMDDALDDLEGWE